MKPLRSVKRPLPLDLDTQGSDYTGLLGLYEKGLRRFKIVGTLVALLPIYFVGIFCLGVSLFPGVTLFQWYYHHIQNHSIFRQSLEISLIVATGYILFGFSLTLLTPFLNFLCRAYPKPWRGPYYSLETLRWAVHNAFTYLPRYMFLDYMTPTPFNILFYRLMGMKIGRNVHINTTNISDPCLIELGDNVTVGGSVTIIAHYGQGGLLVIAPVKVGRGTTIGLRAIILGDVEIGEKVKILPNSVVLPKTRIPSGETWGGVPARKIEITSLRRKE